MNEQHHQWEQLESVMARLAEGDKAAVVTLYVEFGRVLAAVVRRHLARFGMRDVTRDDLDGLVMDACFAIADCAGAWDDRAFALPTTRPTSFGDDDVAPLDARREPVCRLLREAFDDAQVSERDRKLLLETQLQASLGDPSPATTVGMLFDMQPPAVRQAVKRTKDRLRRIAEAESRYAPLADLALLA